MTAERSVISADSHVVEPPDLWTKHLEPHFRDRSPRVISDADTDRWVCEGADLPGMVPLIGAARHYGDPRQGGRYDEVMGGGYDPDVRVKDQAGDGVDAEVLYPSVALRMFTIEDVEFQSALFRAYNTWLAEFCGAHSGRLYGIAAICVDDIEGAVAELHRCKDLGFVGGQIIMEGGRHLTTYDPFWAAAQDLGMPISMHTSTGREKVGDQGLAGMIVYPVFFQKMLMEMVFSGLFDRFPDLRLVGAENGAGWAGNLMERMDYFYTLGDPKNRGIKATRMPSETFRSQIYYTFFMDDRTAVEARAVLGADNLMWSSDFPHLGGTWPHSREMIAKHVGHLPQADAHKIQAGNAAALYRL